VLARRWPTPISPRSSLRGAISERLSIPGGADLKLRTCHVPEMLQLAQIAQRHRRIFSTSSRLSIETCTMPRNVNTTTERGT